MNKINLIEGKLQNNNFAFAIVASRFNDFIVNHLVNGAVDYLHRHNVDREKITIIGPDPSSHVIHYKLHENADNQLEWKEGSLKDPRR